MTTLTYQQAELRGLPLLEAVIAHIDAHPEAWDQGKYFGESECGTTGCVAGWAALFTGAERAVLCGTVSGAFVIYDPAIDASVVTMDGPNDYGLDDNRRRIVSASERAQALIGLTDAEALGLFRGSNTRETVDAWVKRIRARFARDAALEAS